MDEFIVVLAHILQESLTTGESAFYSQYNHHGMVVSFVFILIFCL